MMAEHRKIYVAIVDDDESVQRSLGRLLRSAGFQCVTYPSAEAFLDDEKRPRFDCLLLDIRLAGMSGIDLQRQLVESGSTTPAVFVTAYDAPRLREQTRAAGCAGYFRKSDSSEALLAVIRDVTAQS